MEINDNNARLIDGSHLFFQHKTHDSIYCLLSSWTSGLDLIIFNLDADTSKVDYFLVKNELRLLNEFSSTKGSIVNTFFQSFPKSIPRLIEIIEYRQYDLIRLAAKHRNIDLLTSNPLLLWLTVGNETISDFSINHNNYYELCTYERWVSYRAQKDLSSKQSDILDRILNRRATASDIKILKKIRIQTGNIQTLAFVQCFLNNINEDDRKYLSHMKFIPICLVMEKGRYPDFQINSYYVNLSHDTKKGHLCIHWKTAIDSHLRIVELLYQVNSNFHEFNARIRRAKFLSEFESIKNSLRKLLALDIIKNEPRIEYCKPPFPGIDNIIFPILNSHQLLDLWLNHGTCIYDQYKYKINESNYVYKIVLPGHPMYALAIEHKTHFGYLISELKGPRNSQVPIDVKHFITSCIKNNNKSLNFTSTYNPKSHS